MQNSRFRNAHKASAGILTAALGSALMPTAALAQAAASQDETPVFLAMAEGDRTIVVYGKNETDANPNANENAPYKVEKQQNNKYTEAVRDTPKSITIIPKEVIEDVGATSFREVARTTPGVTLGTGEGGNSFGDRIFIRGFEARNDIYIDGMRDPGVTSREVFAIEQIEIVKGPSSAFGGRGTTGGAVSLASKRALNRDFNQVEATIGTENHYRISADTNHQLSESLAVRVNGLYHNADTPGRDYVDSERYGGAAAVSWSPSNTFRLDGDYYVYRYDGMSDYGHPFDADTGEPFALDADNFYGAVGRDFLKNKADIGTLNAEWRPIDGLTISSQTRYGEVTTQYVVSVPRAPDISDTDPANWTVSTGTPQRNATTKYISNITSANAVLHTGDILHVVVMGAEYSNEKITNRSWAFPEFVETENGTQLPVSGGFTLNLYNPNPVLGYNIPATLNETATPAVTEVKSYSAFLLDTIKFSPKLHLLLGGRLDTFEIRSTGAGRGGAYDTRSNVSFFNWQASALYKPTEALTFYISHATSSNPSGEQLDSSSPTYGGVVGVGDLTPERNKSYEIGAKWELNDGELLISTAVFRIDKDNAREQTSPGVYQNVGKLRSEGFEIGLNGNVTDKWAVFGGYSYLNAKTRNSTNNLLDGVQFANVPKHNFALLSTYALTDNFMVGGQAYYRSRLYGESVQADVIRPSVPGYWRFDLVSRLRLSDDIELRANVLNVADERYYDAIYRSGSPFSYVAPGRSATLSVDFNF